MKTACLGLMSLILFLAAADGMAETPEEYRKKIAFRAEEYINNLDAQLRRMIDEAIQNGVPHKEIYQTVKSFPFLDSTEPRAQARMQDYQITIQTGNGLFDYRATPDFVFWITPRSHVYDEDYFVIGIWWDNEGAHKFSGVMKLGSTIR